MRTLGLLDKQEVIKAHGFEAEIHSGQVYGLMPWIGLDGEQNATWEHVGDVWEWLGY